MGGWGQSYKIHLSSQYVLLGNRGESLQERLATKAVERLILPREYGLRAKEACKLMRAGDM